MKYVVARSYPCPISVGNVHSFWESLQIAIFTENSCSVRLSTLLPGMQQKAPTRPGDDDFT